MYLVNLPLAERTINLEHVTEIGWKRNAWMKLEGAYLYFGEKVVFIEGEDAILLERVVNSLAKG